MGQKTFLFVAIHKIITLQTGFKHNPTKHFPFEHVFRDQQRVWEPTYLLFARYFLRSKILTDISKYERYQDNS